jgi:hypothetical protein
VVEDSVVVVAGAVVVGARVVGAAVVVGATVAVVVGCARVVVVDDGTPVVVVAVSHEVERYTSPPFTSN